MVKLPSVLLCLLLVTAACGDGDSTADAPELLFVQHSDGAVLNDSTLTLSGVSPQTGWFTDRPYREAGQISTAEFVSLWAEGEDSFTENPPNADFTCTVDGEIVNYVVELTSPRLDGDELTYGALAIGATASPGAAASCTNAHLFIDGARGWECREGKCRNDEMIDVRG